MIKVIAASPSHADLIRPKVVFLENPNVRAQSRQAIRTCPCVTLVNEDGGILAIIGMTELWPGVGEMWALTSDLCTLQPISFHKKVQAMLEIYVAENKLKRVQMTVRKSYKQGIDWAIKLGFNPEGVLASYGPEGDDYVMMAKVV